ncbi:MAG TPA: tRNA (cytidine(34)-2'-O)-methyltransferase [Myxococcales bacterium]|nr:tRNA (cytidine(34)-2'-O)-methyltransferase [Myxococcales bacterium]
MDLVHAGARLHVVLVEPQIPPNTGNVARLCAVTGARLHLVGPLGFSIADKDMRRAGLDYWDRLWRRHHADLAEFLAFLPAGARLHLFTARAQRSLWEVRFEPDDYLVFGSEPHGLPRSLLEARPDRTVAIPMLAGSRSLNLATAAGIGLYEGLRQIATGVG